MSEEEIGFIDSSEEDEEEIIDSFDLIKGNNEEILWQRKFSEKELERRGKTNRKYVYFILLDILAYTLFSNIITIHQDIFLNLILLFLIIQSPIIVVIGILIINAENFYEYKSTEYYITNKRVLLRYNSADPYLGDDIFFSLEYERINYVKVMKDKKNKTCYHIEFYSDFILKNPKNYFFYVKREQNTEREQGDKYPVKGWLNTQNTSSLRFSYIENIDNVTNQLKKVISEEKIKK